MNEQNTKYLLETFPDLYRQYYLSPQETCMCWGFECGDGWFEIIKKLSEDITKIDPKVEASQVKEKYGSLRFYTGGGKKRVWQTIQKRKDKDKKKTYYFIIDNFLYIPIPKGELGTPESIRLKAWFIEPWKAEDLNAILQCKDNYCRDIYGSQMPVPEYMKNDVTKELLTQLRSVYLQIQKDEYPDMSSTNKNQDRPLRNEP